MLKRVHQLVYKEAIEMVKERESVYWKSGVWNEYKKRTDIDEVIKNINNAGYGVDVYVDDNGDLYISRPSDGDMF